jgi:hypothetical protein
VCLCVCVSVCLCVCVSDCVSALCLLSSARPLSRAPPSLLFVSQRFHRFASVQNAVRSPQRRGAQARCSAAVHTARPDAIASRARDRVCTGTWARVVWERRAVFWYVLCVSHSVLLLFRCFGQCQRLLWALPVYVLALPASRVMWLLRGGPYSMHLCFDSAPPADKLTGQQRRRCVRAISLALSRRSVCVSV